jgi:hypothetical protein
MKPKATTGPKKPYEAPKLVVYGSLTEMTQTKNSPPTHQFDQAGKSAKRT